MKFLVVGKGGREHALCKALAESESVDQVFALPGNQGMQPQTTLLSGNVNSDEVYRAATEHKVDVVVVGPEDPLVAGMASELRQRGLLVFGPGRDAALLEGSKIFSKKFMEKYQIPTAPFKEVNSVDEVKTQMASFTPPFVFKADGLAAGKGVFICKDEAQLVAAATQVFEEKALGDAGKTALLEQFQPGYELSFFILTNGESYVPLPMAQDHKKLRNYDEGPNTGGMGTVAPMSIEAELYQQIVTQVVEPTVAGLKAEAFDYKGVVFIGLMITETGPQVLEYNVRFGDPETQVLLPLLDGDWGEAFKAIAQGEVPQLKWSDKASACVVLAAENYPSTPVKGVEIAGEMDASDSQYFLHAGTVARDGKWLTNGGRVLNAVGLAGSIEEAVKQSYAQAKTVNWPGMQMRTDIGKGAL